MSFASPIKTNIGQVTWVYAEEVFNSGSTDSTAIFYAAPYDLGTYHIENKSTTPARFTIEAAYSTDAPEWITVTSGVVDPNESINVPSEKFQKYWNPYMRVCYFCENGTLDGDFLVSVVARGLDDDGGELKSRLIDKRVAPNYSLWIDTDNVSHIYILEAPDAATSTDTGFRGIRIPKSLTGISGKVETNLGGTLTFDNKTTDTGWG